VTVLLVAERRLLTNGRVGAVGGRAALMSGNACGSNGWHGALYAPAQRYVA